VKTIARWAGAALNAAKAAVKDFEEHLQAPSSDELGPGDALKIRKEKIWIKRIRIRVKEYLAVSALGN
jgi:Sec-independent protein translocase protein TatA